MTDGTRKLGLRSATLASAAMLGLVASPNRAAAVPSFAAQTGMPCQMCHVGALGPQLTAYGRNFKIHGYTIVGGEGWASKTHVAVWLQEGFTHTTKDSPGGPVAPEWDSNDNVQLQAVAALYAGRVTDHIGVFLEMTYDNASKSIYNDNSDIRIIDDAEVFGLDAVIGASINNGPGWSDPWNSNYIWGFPYNQSTVSPRLNASPVLGGALQTNSLGVVPYIWIDERIYLDAGLYTTQSPGLGKILGNAYGPGAATRPSPYVSATYAWFWGDNNAHLGAGFFDGRYSPAVDVRSVNGQFGHNEYEDYWIHGGYQYLQGNFKHVFTSDGFIYFERQHLKGSSNLASPYLSSSQQNNNLQELRETLTYYYDETWGANISYDKIWGKKNQLLYNTGATDGTGSIKGSPNSQYFLFELDYVPFGKEDSWARPFANLKIGLQYYAYLQFNGRSKNYDGLGHNASDNNTLFLYAWEVF